MAVMTRRSAWAAALALGFATAGLADQKSDMHSYMNEVERQIREQYAPRFFKTDRFSWNLSEEKNSIDAKIAAGLSVPQFHQEVAKFFAAMRDYHVSVSFTATESAALPFTLAATDDGYVITYINRTQLSKERFPFNVGDVVTSFNDEPLSELAERLSDGYATNRERTDSSLTAMMLTRRRAARGHAVPQGTVMVKGTAASGDERVAQLIWKYEPENMKFPDYEDDKDLFASFMGPQTAEEAVARVNQSLSRLYMSPVAADYMAKDADNPTSLGHKKGVLPQVDGMKIWESPEGNEFHAYVVVTDERKTVGVVRIPSYVPGKDLPSAVEDFATVISKMEDMADVLIVDQLNNPGGYIFYLYALASYFADGPFVAPQEKIALSSAMIFDAHESLQALDLIDTLGFGAQGLLSGYPMDAQFITHLRAYYRFLISEWDAGKSLTDAHFFAGVDHITPASGTRYTKPVLLLVNQLDFSGGDFFPAIMQDNDRVKMMGENTAGAGGYVIPYATDNRLGVGGYRLTGSLAIRPDGSTIENDGVSPDVSYVIGRDDIKASYRPLATRALTEALAMIAADDQADESSESSSLGDVSFSSDD